MTAAAPRSDSSPHAAATAPKSRCRVRSGSIRSSRASSSAATSAAVPTYRSETICGLPSTQPISRRYQYGRPLMTFLYRLAMAPPAVSMPSGTLGHRIIQGSSQRDTTGPGRSDRIDLGWPHLKINLARKRGLVGVLSDDQGGGAVLWPERHDGKSAGTWTPRC